MRIKDNYKVRKIANENLIVEQGNLHSDLTKVISLNPTAMFLWDELQGKEFTSQDVADILMKQYDITREQATSDVERWINSLNNCGILLMP